MLLETREVLLVSGGEGRRPAFYRVLEKRAIRFQGVVLAGEELKIPLSR
jgi:hypothetical protein